MIYQPLGAGPCGSNFQAEEGHEIDGGFRAGWKSEVASRWLWCQRTAWVALWIMRDQYIFFCQPMHFSEGGLCLLHLVVKINRAWGSRFLFFVGQGLCSVGAKAHVPWGSRRTFLEGQGARFWRVKAHVFGGSKCWFFLRKNNILPYSETKFEGQGAQFWGRKAQVFGWSRHQLLDGQEITPMVKGPTFWGLGFLLVMVEVTISNGWVALPLGLRRTNKGMCNLLRWVWRGASFRWHHSHLEATSS